MTRSEEYQLFWDYVNKLVERRTSVTTTYLSVNAAITGVVAFLVKDGQLEGWIQQVSAMVLLVSGFIASSLWRQLIKQHSTLIGWWYGRLRALENEISEGTGLLTEEYNAFYSEESGPLIGLTSYQTNLTWIFSTVYSLFAVIILGALFF